MNKKFVSVLVALFLALIIPSQSLGEGEKPFLFVFCNPSFHEGWDKYNPDIVFTAGDFNDFETFIEFVNIKTKGSNRPIQIDIQIHGDNTLGLLYLDYSSGKYNYVDTASVGYIINNLNKVTNKKNMKVYLEACYSEICMERTYKPPLVCPNGTIQAAQAYPTYPIYGIGHSVNFNNFIYLQDRYHCYVSYHDLRNFIGKPPVNKDDSLETYLWAVCSNLMRL